MRKRERERVWQAVVVVKEEIYLVVERWKERLKIKGERKDMDLLSGESIWTAPTTTIPQQEWQYITLKKKQKM